MNSIKFDNRSITIEKISVTKGGERERGREREIGREEIWRWD